MAKKNNNKLMAKSIVELHKGRALHAVASTYPTLPLMIIEAVQNGLDELAKIIEIVLDFNPKSPAIIIRDNGNGVSKAGFDEALQSICVTVKEKGKLGRFGRGMISPLDKCRNFTFTSAPHKPAQEYLEWKFTSSRIKRQKETIKIPCRPRPELAYRPDRENKEKEKVYVDWRTEIKVNWPDAKAMAKISSEKLSEGILKRFSTAMRRNSTIIIIRIIDKKGEEQITEVKAGLFMGKKLDEITIGTTTFRLFIARKTTKGQNGEIQFGETDNDYRIPGKTFAKTTGKWVEEETGKTLFSGILEGEITDSAVSIHPDRKRFEENETLVQFCYNLDDWYNQVGAAFMDELKECKEEERYQELGLHSLEVIQKLLKEPQFAELSKVIDSFSVGSIGQGHADKPPIGKSKDKAVAISGSKKKKDNDNKGDERVEPKKDKPKHRPAPVYGPRGRRRTFVRNDSLNLSFSHIVMEGSDNLWELDSKRGVLHFNIRHPLWAECEDKDRNLMRLQECVAIQALMIETLPDDWQENQRLVFDDFTKGFVFFIKNSPSFNLAGALKLRKDATAKE